MVHKHPIFILRRQHFVQDANTDIVTAEWSFKHHLIQQVYKTGQQCSDFMFELMFHSDHKAYDCGFNMIQVLYLFHKKIVLLDNRASGHWF